MHPGMDFSINISVGEKREKKKKTRGNRERGNSGEIFSTYAFQLPRVAYVQNQ